MEKKIAQRLEDLKAKYPDSSVELWSFDEHRIGLKPLLRKAWFPWWETPMAPVNWKFQWLWLYGFVNPESGETYWWLLPRVKTELFNQVLEDFATQQGLGKGKQVLLVLDQAGWHTSAKVKLPVGLHLEFTPAYSPQLQPAERLWPLANEPVVNRYFSSIEELESVLIERCRSLLTHTRINQRFNLLSLVAS